MKVVIKVRGSFPVTHYGGTQRVMWGLGRQLAAMGHKVCYLVDRVGGECQFAELRPLRSDIDFYSQIPMDADIVHLNEYWVDATRMPVPYVITVHGNKVPQQLDPNVVFVSQNHAERFGSSSFVLNGLDWDELPPVVLNSERSGYHFLANAAYRTKNVRGAIAVVLRADAPRLEVLGGHRLNFKHGFRLTLSPRVHFHGMVDDAAKYAVMRHSRGLLFPVTWHEPFGLAVIESLYAGCPVFATPYGAMPELVTDRCFGLLTDSLSTMADALLQPTPGSDLQRQEYARECFSARRMALDYLRKYEAVLSGTPLNPSFGPRQQDWRDLPWKP